MRLTADKEIVNAAARYSISQGLVYLNNPKVACSTIKTSLWKASDDLAGNKTYAGDPHARQKDPFVKNLFSRQEYNVSRLGGATFFSVVRNPYVRILSAYLDKIGRDPWIWLPFCQRFGIHESITKSELSFRDFLVILGTEPDELLDVHFRPQYLNLLWPVCRPHFVGRMEEFSGVVDFLAQHKIPIEAHQYHATKSRELIETYYSDETIALVLGKYAGDFRMFGYSTDIGDIDAFGSVEPAGYGCEPLMSWITADRFPRELVDEHSRSFDRFSRLPTREDKIALVSEAYPSDDNWKRLQSYASFAVLNSEHSLAQDIIARIMSLRRNHYALVQNASIFTDHALR